jgi:hypothetical protein
MPRLNANKQQTGQDRQIIRYEGVVTANKKPPDGFTAEKRSINARSGYKQKLERLYSLFFHWFLFCQIKYIVRLKKKPEL